MPDQRNGRSGDSSPFLSVATAIGEQLVGRAKPAPGGIGWTGDDLLGSDAANLQVVHRPIGPDLYGGVAGIGWYLGHLAAVTDSATFADTSLSALQTALSQAGVEQNALSLYTGATGVALATIVVADRLNVPELARQAAALAHEIALALRRSEPAPETDLLVGSSGIIIGLLAIYRRRPDPEVLETCRFLCQRLASTAHHAWWGTSWPDSAPGPALCGLGHGMSGIGWALAETAWATDDNDLRVLASEAFRYERSFFSPVRGAWPDLRGVAESDDAALTSWTSAWCHGAIGIGAVRLRVYEATGDLSALADASAALQTARATIVQTARDSAHGMVRDVTLCHGIGGIAELFLLAGEVFAAEDHHRAAGRVGELMLAMFEANGREWPFGLPDTHDIPGLFLGLAGIGVTMLRLHDTAAIGSPMLAGRKPAAATPTSEFAHQDVKE
jgi:lantibiotic modifying enzyme